MRKFLAGIGTFISMVCVVFFILAAVLALILVNINRHLLDASIYKRSLNEINAYERLPSLVGSLLESTITYDLCVENPIRCEDISPELRMCYTGTLGENRYLMLISGEDQPTESENQLINSCLTQESGSAPEVENKIQTAPIQVQDCIKQSIGQVAYDELISNQRLPNPTEERQIASCFEAFGFQNQASDSGMLDYFKDLNAEEWQSVIKIILPPDQIKLVIESFLDDLFNFLNGEIDQVTVQTISTKNRLLGPAEDELLVQIFSALQPCTVEELVYLTNPSIGEADILCNPPDDVMDAIFPAIQDQFNTAVAQIPDEVVVIQPITPDLTTSEQKSFVDDPIASFRSVRLLLRLSPLLPIALLLLITIIAVRSPKGWMRWWGVPIFFTGIITIVINLLAKPAINQLWSTSIEPKVPAYLAADITSFAQEFFSSIAHDLSERTIVHAIILLFIGLVAWIVSYFIKPKTSAGNTIN